MQLGAVVILSTRLTECPFPGRCNSIWDQLSAKLIGFKHGLIEIANQSCREMLLL